MVTRAWERTRDLLISFISHSITLPTAKPQRLPKHIHRYFKSHHRPQLVDLSVTLKFEFEPALARRHLRVQVPDAGVRVRRVPRGHRRTLPRKQ
jgi:hypothetical protein